MTYKQGLWDAIDGLPPQYPNDEDYMAGYNARWSCDP